MADLVDRRYALDYLAVSRNEPAGLDHETSPARRAGAGHSSVVPSGAPAVWPLCRSSPRRSVVAWAFPRPRHRSGEVREEHGGPQHTT